MRLFSLAIVVAAAFHGGIARGEDAYSDILLRPTVLAPDAGDDKAAALLKELFNATHAEVRIKYNYWQQGVGNADGLIDAIERFHTVRLEREPMGDHHEFLRQQIAFVKKLEGECPGTKSNSKYQALVEIDEAALKSFRLASELALTRLGDSGEPKESR
jgi:hypothetical protein